ncbi:MAG: efflux RND transporter periplasmic adaptor subunit [Thermodesulfovibrionales bacterium]|jgi:cobalt-zinc-cadmium efflux system membrane fusion protein
MKKQSHCRSVSANYRPITDASIRRLSKQILFLCWLLLFVISGAGCHSAGSETPGNSRKDIIKSSDPNVIEMDHPERFSLAAVESGKIVDEIPVNGVVTPEVNRSVAVVSLGGGRVVEIKARLGDDVQKGQLLLRIHSPDLAAAFSDYQKAQADEVLAHKQLERSGALYEGGASIAKKDLEAAQNAEDKAQVDVKTARDHIHVLGGDPDHGSPILDVRAPISGTIVEQNVTGAAGVRSLDNSPNLFTIADLSRVWVLCDLYEDTISRVHLGDIAEVRLNAYPDRLLHGRVGNISGVLDPNTRSAKVRIELDNPGGLMRSGMFATAELHSGKRLDRLVLPTSAIVRLHDKNWVFMPLGGNRFRKIEVQTGPSAGDNLQQVLSGVKIHDRVVANALQFSSASEAK